jgi:phosphatidylethanolamine-binding protein (PEBP) family uncharacterized protein
VIQVFALDIAPGDLEGALTRAQLETRITSHVLASASVFERYGQIPARTDGVTATRRIGSA